jgi:hypothetical protein
MERVRRRIKDKRVLALVKAFLKAGVMTAVNYFEDSLSGTPRAGYVQLNITRLMRSAGLCAVPGFRACLWPVRRASAAHNADDPFMGLGRGPGRA